MRWFLILALLFAAPVYAQEPPEWFTASLLDIPEDVAEAAKQGKRVMVYFSQDGCPYCKQLVTVNFRDPKIVEKLRRHFAPLALNIWGDREVTWYGGQKMSEKQFAAMLKIQFTPTLIFFNEKGGVALRLNGYLPPDKFYDALDVAIGKGPPLPAVGKARPVDLRRKPGTKPPVVLLLSPDCDACDELERNLQLPAVSGPLAQFELVRVPNHSRVRTNSGETLLESGYVPALVFLDARGREVFRTEAYLRPFHLASALEYVSSGSYAREPSFQRFLQARAEQMRSRGERVDLWN
jgi:thioredoxin-related protein